MSDDTAAVKLPDAAPSFFERHRRLRAVGRTFAAMWCGFFVTSAAAALTTPSEGGFGDICVIVSAALLIFALVTAVEICRWEEAVPRYGFAAVSAVAAWLIPAEWRIVAVWISVLPLCLWFRFGRRWFDSRLALLMLGIVAVLFMYIEPQWDVRLPESAYLPVSLLADKPRVRMIAVGEDIPEEWWRDLGYVDFVTDAPADVAIAGNDVRTAVLSYLDKYGMISRGEPYRRGVYRHLLGRLEPDGVLVLPKRELHLLPAGDWHFAPLPGALDDWVAARRGSAPVTDPEELDKRLQAHDQDDDPLVPAGAFAAVYYAPDVQPVNFEPQAHRVPLGSWWRLLAAGEFLYFCVRLLLCRREKTSNFVAALENALTFTLFSLGSAQLLGEAEFTLEVPLQLMFAGFGIFLLPLRPGKTGAAIFNNLGAAVLLVPLLFPGNAPVLWGCWFAAALCGAVLREGLAEKGSRYLALSGTVAGLLTAVGIYALLLIFRADTFAAVSAVVIVFRSGLYLRYWRG